MDRLADMTAYTDDGCLEYLGPKTPTGYGVITVADHKTRVVHRVAYEVLVGPIPDDLPLDHLCRNRICVLPEHLEPVTTRENNRRSLSPSGLNAAKTECKRGHAFTAENTRINAAGSRVCKACARMHALATYHRTKGGATS